MIAMEQYVEGPLKLPKSTHNSSLSYAIQLAKS